jgi:spoIIIJ-associated protein
MAEELSVEMTGETVGEAKWAALRELERLRPGLDKSTVRFQVVSEGERGLLGVGYSPARVVATVAENGAAAPVPDADESDLAAAVHELVTRITAGIGISCRVDVEERDDAVVATCSGRDLGLLIGHHGQTIDAVQYLVNAILFRRMPGKPAVVDAAGYRARREASLSALARRAADDALRRGERIELEPMTAVERKIVHLELKDAPGVETASEGTEPNRFVVVYPGGAD